MIRSVSKRSFCGAGKNNKMANAVQLPRCREVATLFSPSDRILNKLNENTFIRYNYKTIQNEDTFYQISFRKNDSK